MRIAQHHRTPYLFLENVKGLLSHDGGRTFETIIRTLDELGYDCQWQVLNSKDFGVPQNRERVFIIGHLRGEPRPEVFPVGEVSSDLNEGAEQPGSRILSNTIDSSYYKGADGKRTVVQVNGQVHQDYRVYDPEGVAPTLNANRGGGSAAHPQIIVDYKNPNSKTRRGRVKEGYTGALETTPQIAVNGIRRLIPTECERLQGFPDGWTEGVSDTQRYKMMGNAVTVNVIEAIASRLVPVAV
jgi:DNA (cytosine-5)-methyltransferase 1